MRRKDKNLYTRIRSLIDIEWKKDNSIFDEDQNRYILEFSDSFLFFYPSTGKILLSKNNHLKTVFRDSKTVWLTEGINDKLKEIEC